MTTVDPNRTIAGIEPGHHLCWLYQSQQEHRALLTPFLRRGLAQGERVIYVVDAHPAEAVLGYLRDDGLEPSPYLASGQLSILTADEAYLRDGAFDPDAMVALLRAETDRALADGYAALRVTGEMTWVLRGLPGSEALIEYESKLNEFFPGSKCLALCQYDRRRFEPGVLLDVLTTHRVAVVGTELFDNFYYVLGLRPALRNAAAPTRQPCRAQAHGGNAAKATGRTADHSRLRARNDLPQRPRESADSGEQGLRGGRGQGQSRHGRKNAL